jgi:hypothetical protein
MKRLRTVGVVGIGLASWFSLACGGGSSSSATTTSTSTTNGNSQTGANVAPIVINSGPAGGYADGAFANVTVCVPGTSTCQTIDGVLVDTGSTGLRLLSSALTVSLTQQNTSRGNPVVECLRFVDSYTWGPVQTADVEIAGEKASSLPIQVINGSEFSVPSGCTKSSSNSADTLETLGANGILGVGLFTQDCGAACVQTGTTNPGLYYECSSTSSCQLTGESLTQQVQNPISLFAKDNNGVIIELPAVSSPEVTLSGSLIFGIGTESNNALNGATIYTANDYGDFTATYTGVSGKAGSYTSFIDSGSNGYFFLDSAIPGIPDCADVGGFYCPATTQNITATVQGANGASDSVSFSIANADTLFNTDNGNDTVFSQLGGPAMDTFDFGLPFFFGRNVYTGMQSSAYPDGYWAY